MNQHQATMLPVLRPQLPTADALESYLRRIDEARVYSNFGPLYHEFSERLADYFGVGKAQIALIANGTLALQAAIETVGTLGDTWVIPSFTFVASGQAALAARRKIHFVDVHEATWMIRPEKRPYARGHMIVAPFGSRPEIADWVDVAGPKVIDAASCFDACAGLGAEIDDSSMLMVSLHATKPLAAGEGAVLVGPQQWIKRAAQWANFGFAGSRIALGSGMNAKLSEYHAAVGLASLDAWPQVRRSWQSVGAQALDVVDRRGLQPQPSLRQGFVTSTWNVLLPDGHRADEATGEFARLGIGTRSWWPCGVDEMDAFSDQTVDALPVTRHLVRQVLGLPFGPSLTRGQIASVDEALGLYLASTPMA